MSDSQPLYLYANGAEYSGPVSEEQLLAMARKGAITPATTIRRADKARGLPAHEWPFLASLWPQTLLPEKANAPPAAPLTERELLTSINGKLLFFVWVTVAWLALTALGVVAWFLTKG